MSFLFCAADKEEHHERHILQPDCPAGMPRTGDGPAGPERPGGRLPERKIWTKPAEGSGADDQFPAVFAAAEGPHAADPHGRRRRVRRHQLPVPRALYRGAHHPGGGAAERRPGRGPGEQGRGRHRGSANHDRRHQQGPAGRLRHGAGEQPPGTRRHRPAGGRGRGPRRRTAAGLCLPAN